MKIKSKDIAKELHLSEATVSLVLNERPGVSEATRRRVKEYLRAKEEEYYGKRAEAPKEKKGLILMLQYIKH